MNESYNDFFQDIDNGIREKFGTIELDFNIIGFVALNLAGLPDRGTKDVDTLRTGILDHPQESNIQTYLKDEFGKHSPGSLRHGMFLDLVGGSIPWLPPHPKFVFVQKLKCIVIHRLDPLDVCISKVFSNFLSKNDRARDKSDILDTLDNRIIDFQQFITRLGKTMPRYEMHAEAPEVFPRIMQFVEELQSDYGPAPFNYQLPDWMERM